MAPAGRPGSHRAHEPRGLARGGRLQPVGPGRGLFDVGSLNAIHAKMHKALGALGGRIDAVFYCPHSPDEAASAASCPACSSRSASASAWTCAPRTWWATRARPAGRVAVGRQPHPVLTGKAAGLLRPAAARYPANTRVHADLSAFADWLTTRARAPRHLSLPMDLLRSCCTASGCC